MSDLNQLVPVFPVYLIKSAKGYWKHLGHGYTNDRKQAGQFDASSLRFYNLDGVTLELDRRGN